jgi:hypothetical protein
MNIRIIDQRSDGELPEGYVVQQIIIPPRQPPKPLKKTRAQAAVEANQRLEQDVRKWTARAIWAGL